MQSPYEVGWAGSAHADASAVAFNDWNDVGKVPLTCARCHTPDGYVEFISTGKVITDVAISPGHVITCIACHNDTASALSEVTFPSGAVVKNLGPDARCMLCHQGRESTAGMNKLLAGYQNDVVSDKISFRNIHYFAAAATLFGTDAKGAYEYDGQAYVGFNTRHPMNKCTDCHDAHALNVKLDACKSCHGAVTDPAKIRYAPDTTDWNGNGDAQEPMASEIAAFQARLYVAIQKYAIDIAKSRIVYETSNYPYYFLDVNKDGKPDTDDKGALLRYNAWTPRLLKAAYNYQFSIKDPGTFAHNPMYVMQFLYDSIKDLGGDVSSLTRPK
jgi:hypothetical protein